MIRDIIELPVRDITGELDTGMPRFTYVDNVDDISWFGRVIDLDSIKQVYKYKTIETIGSDTIERVFMTQEPIEFDTKWFLSKIRIYPIFYRVYHWPCHGKADVYRYLIGTTDILDVFSCGSWQQQTIYDHTYKNFCPDCIQWKSPRDKMLSKKVVGGDDERNLEWVASYNLLCQYHGGEPQETVTTPTTFNQDVSSDMFLDGLECIDLKPIMSRDFGTSLASQFAKQIKAPFEINGSTVFSIDEHYPAKWNLHRLLYLLDSSAFTDVRIEVDVLNQHKVKCQSELYSRYIGLTNKHPAENAQKQIITEQLRKMAVVVSGPRVVNKIILTKTWLEEVYIEITADGYTTRYYFDLATYSLANMSFVDILG